MTLSFYRAWTALVQPASLCLTGNLARCSILSIFWNKKKRSFLLFAACCAFQLAQAQSWSLVTGTNDIYYNLGNVGIGTPSSGSSGAKLEVKGNVLGSSAGNTTQILRLGAAPIANYSTLNVGLYRNAAGASWITATTRLQAMTDNVPQAYIDFNPPGELYGMALGTGNNEMMRFLQNGTIGIGTTNPGTNKLAVEGTIAARKVVVTIANPFPDYVFKKDYRLPSLSSITDYIRANGHLPEMPTAASVEKNGLDLGSNQTLMVKKIEELTLYLIQQNKEMKVLKQHDKMLEKQNRQLRSMQERINRLEKNLYKK